MWTELDFLDLLQRLRSPVLAVLMAFSRMYLYVHYPTDILGGILVGCLTGAVGSWLAALLLQLTVHL